MMNEYFKVRVILPGGKRRSFWARKIRSNARRTVYRVVDGEGDKLNELVIASALDIVSEKPATMNLKYARLQLTGHNDGA